MRSIKREPATQTAGTQEQKSKEVYYPPKKIKAAYDMSICEYCVPGFTDSSGKEHILYRTSRGFFLEDGTKIKLSSKLLQEIEEDYRELSLFHVQTSNYKHYYLEEILKYQTALSKDVAAIKEMSIAERNEVFERLEKELKIIKEWYITKLKARDLEIRRLEAQVNLKKLSPDNREDKIRRRKMAEKGYKTQGARADDSHLTDEDKRKFELEKKRLEIEEQEDVQDDRHLERMVELKKKVKAAPSNAPESAEKAPETAVPEATPATDKTEEPAPDAIPVPVAQQAEPAAKRITYSAEPTGEKVNGSTVYVVKNDSGFVSDKYYIGKDRKTYNAETKEEVLLAEDLLEAIVNKEVAPAAQPQKPEGAPAQKKKVKKVVVKKTVDDAKTLEDKFEPLKVGNVTLTGVETKDNRVYAVVTYDDGKEKQTLTYRIGTNINAFFGTDGNVVRVRPEYIADFERAYRVAIGKEEASILPRVREANFTAYRQPPHIVTLPKHKQKQSTDEEE